MKKAKITFSKFVVNGTTFIMHMMSTDEWSVGVSLVSGNPKIEHYNFIMPQTNMVQATKQEFIEFYNKVYAIVNSKTMTNL